MRAIRRTTRTASSGRSTIGSTPPAQADVHLRLKNGTFEVRNTLQRGEWGVTQDDAGRIYRNTNESALHVDLVPTAYFARNPNLLRTRGSYERLANDNPDLNIVWPVRPNPGTNRAYQVGIDRADGTLAKFTPVCAPLVYRGDRLPAELYGNVFVAEPARQPGEPHHSERRRHDAARAQGLRRGRVPGLHRRALPSGVSSPTRPTGRCTSPTCIAGSSQHRISHHRVPARSHSRAQARASRSGSAGFTGSCTRRPRRDTSIGACRGRRRRPAGGGALASERLVARDRAAAARRARRASRWSPALVTLAAGAQDWRTRLHALWTLDGIDSIERGDGDEGAGGYARREVRASAVRIAERWLGEAGDPIQAAVLEAARRSRSGRSGSSSPRRSARCRRDRAKAPSSRCSSATRTIRSRWMPP